VFPVVNFLQCVVTEVVLFSIVALMTLMFGKVKAYRKNGAKFIGPPCRLEFFSPVYRQILCALHFFIKCVLSLFCPLSFSGFFSVGKYLKTNNK